MKEKRYPILDEEDGLGCMKAKEPIGALAYAETTEDIDLLDDEDDNIDWDKMPLIGPATYEEAIAQIEAAEQEIANGEVYDWKDVLKEARQRILSYAH
ncbi:MAG: hypothetical protein IJQ60_08870 [Prevotella sp.]|nr:hypothetical protein [Prevotella sp.]MBR0263982.1 hypothetical protein [Prevotella sp.]